MGYIDSHAHYLARQFDRDREQVLEDVFNSGVDKIIECGTDSKTNVRAVRFAESHKNVYTTIGYFPTSTMELEDENVQKDFLLLLKSSEKIVGIGEIGLDKHRSYDLPIQLKWFDRQLVIAKYLNLPVCIHSRDAEEETLKILENNGPYRGVIHCYSYGVETMKKLLDLGYYFGVGGTCTYKSNIAVREAIKEMPLNRILLETDSPYLAPNPLGKERNDSRNIAYVIRELSRLKGVPEDIIIEQTNKNVKSLYLI